MNQSQLNSLLRDVLKLLGSFLVLKGYSAAGTFLGGEQAVGLALSLAGFVWSWLHHGGDDSTPPSKPPTGLTALLLIFAASGLLLMSPGCASTPAGKVYQAEGVAIHSVNTAMQIWADQVKAGKATQEQIDTVKRAYAVYYDAQQVAKAALEKWIASGSPNDQAACTLANNAAANAVSAVVNLVQLYRK